MRLGFQLGVAGAIALFVSMAHADDHDVVVESVDAGHAMQSFPPDLSGLEDEAGMEATEAEVPAADEAPAAGEAPVDDEGSEAADESAMEADVADDAWADVEEDGDVWDTIESEGIDDGEVMAEADADAWADESVESETVASSEPQIEEGTTLVVNGVELGPVGIDGEGRVGRVHTVKQGDTLWDVSHAYLGTSWVWPSVWNDNEGIANPHVISPGDRLWISSTEIRAITNEEADAYVAEAELAVNEEPEPTTVAAEIDEDMDFEEEFVEEDEFLDMAAMDEFAAEEMEQLPVGMEDGEGRSNDTGRVLRVSMRENMSFVSDVQLEAATTILDSPSDRRFLAAHDTIYFGLGEGEVEVGDEFTLFRNITEVRARRSKDLIGYHVDVLGWAEVTEVTDDTCVAVIRTAVDGAVRGDRVMPRYEIPSDIKVKYAEDDVEGEVVFLPASRTLMGTTDYVFLDVGAVHGVEIGTDLEVYDGGIERYDAPRDADVYTPDRVVADLVVVTVQEESSVAYVAHTRRELAVGDSVRGTTRHFPGAF